MANILIFMNVYDQSVIMSDLVREGYVITPEVAEVMTPYRTGRYNRFGHYSLNETRECSVVDYTL